MKKIIISLAMIAAVATLVAGATGAFFSDTEESTGNTFTLGEIDINVNGENPWTTKWENYLDKPSQTNYMNFTIENVGTNPAKVWKKITGINNEGGDDTFCGASSEPEYIEGGGLVGPNQECQGTYVERNNLSAFMIYDMAICKIGAELGENGAPCACLTNNDDDKGNGAPIAEGNCWEVLVDEADQVRVDNVTDTWVELTGIAGLAVDEKLVVSQSYHLMTWDDAGQPMITNWAQGDIMKFDVELEARQIDAPAPGTTEQNGKVYATANLSAKNTTTWVPGGATGTLTYEVAANKFNYSFSATGLANGDYQLIYYPDPWTTSKTVVLIGNTLTASGGNIAVTGQSFNLATDLPQTADANYPVGAKVWLVPTESLSGTQLSWTNLDKFLFDMTLVKYDDLDGI